MQIVQIFIIYLPQIHTHIFLLLTTNFNVMHLLYSMNQYLYIINYTPSFILKFTLCVEQLMEYVMFYMHHYSII